MKKIYFLLLVAVLSFTSCHTDIWNSINDLDSRVKVLEELCREMNTNINSLQALIEVLQNGDYITNIVPITKGGEVIGYTITFKNHEPITIYNGEDGSVANTPIIGAAQDTDGVYYWTVNGEWLLDDNGNKIRVTGNDGRPGSEGQTGPSGITPTLKIEDGMWYVSYDNGSTWTLVGQATGDPGQDGDNMFANITYDSNSVTFTLNDGTVIVIPIGNGNNSHGNIMIMDGAILIPFSVSNSNSVYFSCGNLQYHDLTNIWRFASTQYELVPSDNPAGWIDHFGWGTGNNPTLDTSNDNDYSQFTDWGINPISNGGNQSNQWRTLTSTEWRYIIYGRVNADRLLFRAMVNGVRGLVLLPDSWITNTANDISLPSYSLGVLGFSNNVYNLPQWQVFESYGAVFLSTSIQRESDGDWDVYWSSSRNNYGNYRDFLYIGYNTISYESSMYGTPHHHYNVRLVKDVPTSSNN